MTKIENIYSKACAWMPKEVPAAVLGTVIASISGVALQFFTSSLGESTRLPDIAVKIVRYGSIAGAVAGTVLAVYSMVRLCQKMISEKHDLSKAAAATAFGVFTTAVAHGVGEHVWDMAPSFDWLMGHSVAYCVGTNLAWQSCAIAGFAGIVFTGYAAYRTGQAMLTMIDPAVRASSPL